MNVEFIFDAIESNYSKLECYLAYDFEENKLIKDIELNRTMVMIDRNNEIIYFANFECGTHWILQKNYFYKIIQKFMEQVEDYNCKDYTVCQDCTGGKIYYKYK